LRVEDFIDLDECGVFVETAVSISAKRCRKQSKAVGKLSKVREMDALTRSRWVSGGREVANDVVRRGDNRRKMIEFIEMILNTIGPGAPARRRCFTMDNLS